VSILEEGERELLDLPSAPALLLFLYLPWPVMPGEPERLGEPPFPGSYLAAVTDFTEMVSPLAVPVTLASSQASLLSSSRVA
jgi:hypothetical protein